MGGIVDSTAVMGRLRRQWALGTRRGGIRSDAWKSLLLFLSSVQFCIHVF